MEAAIGFEYLVPPTLHDDVDGRMVFRRDALEVDDRQSVWLVQCAMSLLALFARGLQRWIEAC